MNINRRNNETRSFWKRAMSSEKFEKDGLWGLRTASGEIVLEPKYDQIEFCTDFIYAHYNARHIFFHRNGGSRDCADRDDDYRFYANGFIGLKNRDGGIFLPAIYDKIIDWGEECDVVYVRRGEEYHYYNHKHEEILTEVEMIPKDKYPNCPYNLGEDQHRHVLLCVEPIDKPDCNRDCFAYNQWVRLSRIPCSMVREIFSCCEVVEMSSDAINHFEDKSTYIYSARVCKSSGEYPLTACVKKLKSLGCYDASWDYLLKISINRETKVNPQDLYNVIKHFEDIDEGLGYCRFSIAIDYDSSLAVGEVKLFQIHYFWDDMGAFLHDVFLQDTLPNGTVKDIRSYLNKHSPIERRKLIRRAYWFIGFSDTRSWRKTKSVLEYLKSEGADNCTELIMSKMEINPYYIEKISLGEWQFKKDVITWALENGGLLNLIRKGKTLFEDYMEDLSSAKELSKDDPDKKEAIKTAEAFAEWLRAMGATTAVMQRKKIESRLGGLAPKEVIDLVSMKSLFIPRTYTDWRLDEDELQNYKFEFDDYKHKLRRGDRVMLFILGRPNCQFGTIFQVEQDGIIVHTDEWLDISEEYIIRLV